MSRFNALIVLLLACGAVLVEGQLRCQNATTTQSMESASETQCRDEDVGCYVKFLIVNGVEKVHRECVTPAMQHECTNHYANNGICLTANANNALCCCKKDMCNQMGLYYNIIPKSLYIRSTVASGQIAPKSAISAQIFGTAALVENIPTNYAASVSHVGLILVFGIGIGTTLGSCFSNPL
ncbi:hypothetical protein WR25_16059 [Diploscapter pachys]|uniref:Activin types I and II receptor domain-containing protein n=1 Tax=Diploscapter pachys TaxID=2018661 RepID=A0A2A2KJ18_9BILA|nr:hypothetical protein WR25_16059 [Diploscapter pachys]